MRKFFWAICAAIFFTVTLTVGGVFAVFGYAQKEAAPKQSPLNMSIQKFVYGTSVEMQAVLDVALTDKTYGLNAPGYSEGMKQAILYTFFSRVNYGYVGTMDNSYGDKVYGKEVYENISVVISFSKKVDGVDTLYMYMVEKSKAQLTAMAEGEILNNVFRATFIQNKSTANDWNLKLLPDGSPDVRKGSSVVKNYEGQTDGTKTFGFYSKEEIWVEN